MAWGTPCQDNHLFQLSPPTGALAPRCWCTYATLKEIVKGKKRYMPTLESEMFAKMPPFSYVHFAEYSCTRKNGTQLVPNLVWWKAYKGFCKEFPSITYQDKTQKECMGDTLKSTTTSTSNEQGHASM